MYLKVAIIIAGCVFGTRSFSQVTIIARTNLGLFEEMARVLRTPGGDKKRLGFVGVRVRRSKRVCFLVCILVLIYYNYS